MSDIMSRSSAGGGAAGAGAPHEAASVLGGAGGTALPTLDPDVRACIDWLKRGIKLKGYTPAAWTEDHDTIAASFFTTSDVRKLVAYMSTDGALSLLTPFSSLAVAPKAFCYWVRRDHRPPTSKTVRTAVQFGFINGGGMDSLLRVMQDVYLPTMNTTTLWPESVRKDFVGQMHRFMASVVETNFQLQGKTVLYLPAESVSADPAAVAADKDLVQRLEATVIHWTRQIKEVVSNQDNATTSSETGGPLEEIEFWSSRTQDLSGITQQLNAPELLNIINVLREAGSSYLGPFDTLAKSIQRGSEEANDNLRFLQLLKGLCESLAVARVPDIPALLPDILARIRVIGAISRYYHAEERITGLLRKISNEVRRAGRLLGDHHIAQRAASGDAWRLQCGTMCASACVARRVGA
ncbi:hypothetical protein EON62_00890 [archaeon]|nr:MAG: hypothetical protein EON62_00890 [archaeon]